MQTHTHTHVCVYCNSFVVLAYSSRVNGCGVWSGVNGCGVWCGVGLMGVVCGGGVVVCVSDRCIGDMRAHTHTRKLPAVERCGTSLIQGHHPGVLHFTKL